MPELGSGAEKSYTSMQVTPVRRSESSEMAATVSPAAAAAIEALEKVQRHNEMDESSFMAAFDDVSPEKMKDYLQKQFQKAQAQARKHRHETVGLDASSGESSSAEKDDEAFKAQLELEMEEQDAAMEKTAQLLSQQRAAQLQTIALRRKSDELADGTPAKQIAQRRLEKSHQKAQDLARRALAAAGSLLQSQGYSVSPGESEFEEDWGSPILCSPKQLLRGAQSDASKDQLDVIEKRLDGAPEEQRLKLELSQSLLLEFDESMSEKPDYDPAALAEELLPPQEQQRARVLPDDQVGHEPPPQDLAEEQEAGSVVLITTPLSRKHVAEAQRISYEASKTAQKAAKLPLPGTEAKDGFAEVLVHQITDVEEDRFAERMAAIEDDLAADPKKNPTPPTFVRKAPLTPGRKAGMGLAIGGGFAFAFSAAASVYFISQASGLVGIPPIASLVVACVSLVLLIAGVALLCKHTPGRVVTQSVLNREQQAATTCPNTTKNPN